MKVHYTYQWLDILKHGDRYFTLGNHLHAIAEKHFTFYTLWNQFVAYTYFLVNAHILNLSFQFELRVSHRWPVWLECVNAVFSLPGRRLRGIGNSQYYIFYCNTPKNYTRAHAHMHAHTNTHILVLCFLIILSRACN